MKKIIIRFGLPLLVLALAVSIPVQSKASVLSEAKSFIQAAYNKIKVENINVQGKIWSNVGPVRIKDRLNVKKELELFLI